MIARWLVIAVLALAVGCGEDAEAPEPKLQDPPGYYGLKVCTCYLYETDGSTDKLGIGIERTVKRKDVDTYELKYRNGSGVLFRTELLEPTSPDLLLWDVTMQGGAPSWRLDEGLPLVRWPVERRADTPVNAEAPVTYRENANQTETVNTTMTLRADYGSPEAVTFQRGDQPESADGVRVSYLLGAVDPAAPAPAMGPRTFVPDVGFVTLEQFDTGVPSGPRTWNLVAVRPIDGCPFEGEPPITARCDGLGL